MVTYLFFPQLADGSASTFIAYDLFDEREAKIRAERVLAEHGSAIAVAIWRDDHLVGRVFNPQATGFSGQSN